MASNAFPAMVPNITLYGRRCYMMLALFPAGWRLVALYFSGTDEFDMFLFGFKVCPLCCASANQMAICLTGLRAIMRQMSRLVIKEHRKQNFVWETLETGGQKGMRGRGVFGNTFRKWKCKHCTRVWLSAWKHTCDWWKIYIKAKDLDAFFQRFTLCPILLSGSFA